MIKYRFASSEGGTVLDIHDLDSSARGRVFTCIACSGRLVPHLKDDLRARHFAHHRHASLCPGRETYLHRAAKALFYQAYRARLQAREPYQLAIPVTNTCIALRDELGLSCEYPAVRDHDLTSWYEHVELEACVGKWRADVLLTSRTKTRRPLFVEFAVTHPCEKDKVESGQLIIEIPIRHEEDLAQLRKHRIVVSAESQIRAHNFKPKPETGLFCARTCPRHAAVFVVHSSGAAKLFDVPAAKAMGFHPVTTAWRKVLTKFEPAPGWVDVGQLEYQGADLPKGDSLFERACLAAMLDGAPIVNCYACQNRGDTSLLSNVWCHTFRKEVHHNGATKCESYRRMTGAQQLRALEMRVTKWRRRVRSRT